MPTATTGGIATSVANPFLDLWATFSAVLPEIIAAILVFIVGWLIAATLGAAVRRFVRQLKVDEFARTTGITGLFEQAHLKVNFAAIIGWAVKWFFIIAFLIAAADILGWPEVTNFLKNVALYIPNVIVAVIILAVGLVAGKFVENLISQGLQTTQFPQSQARTLSKTGRVAVIVFAVLAALTQLGIAERLIEILFAGIVAALALAFGLGGKEKAAEVIRKTDRSA